MRVRSTMRATPGWNALMFADPPEQKPLGGLPGLMADRHGLPVPKGQPYFHPNKGAPVRLYICEVCGYVELYAGIIVGKKVWG